MKTFYELLGVEATVGSDEIKRAFRREIARYHPDKVQHLGPEFQEIAASRASELTEAYRVLMDPASRARYDVGIGGAPADRERGHRAPAAAAAPTPGEPPPPPPYPEPGMGETVSESVKQTRAKVSHFVHKATLERLTDAMADVFADARQLSVEGFDAAFALRPRRGLFQKGDPPVTLLLRILPRVEAAAVEDAWPLAVKAAASGQIVCLLLLGAGLAPARELADAITGLRRRTRSAGPILVPVDMRDWHALLPPDTPSGVRMLLDRLKPGA